MKTCNYNITLMTPMQIDKEIIFNEALNTLDSFCNYIIEDFVDIVPFEAEYGKKYIINNGEQKNFIYYCQNMAKGWQFLSPKNGMIMFVRRWRSFFIFNDEIWNKLDLSHQKTGDNFTGIFGHYEIEDTNNSYFYLYLNGNCQLNLDNVKAREFIIIIKQNIHNCYQLLWESKITWLKNTPHQLTQLVNKKDIIRFYRIPEENHFFAEILGQDY